MVSDARTCVQCGKAIPSAWSQQKDNRVITGGICADCFRHFNAQSGIPLRAYLDGIAEPVLMLDSDANVVIANKTAQNVLKKDPSRIEGFRGGDVFECAYARLPGGCGRTVHCSGCTIRRAITETFHTGVSQLEIPAYLNQQISTRSAYLDLHISTERAWNMVLLRIDDMKPGVGPHSQAH